MALSLSKIEAIAPDQGSLSAAKKLLKLSSWPGLFHDGKGLVWGECQGSGSTPYRVSVTEDDAGYKCSCPSRKFPCKHSLALMWIRAEGREQFALADAPGWVTDWLARRRGPSAGAGTAPRASIAETEGADTGAEADPKAEARAAAARERSRRERESAIAGGLEDLDAWLRDQISAGLVSFAVAPSGPCRTMAQRLVDAKAGGLAARVDAIPARLFQFPEEQRAIMAVRELGGLHLLASAYLRQAEIPELLREDVRQAVGWNMARDAVLSASGSRHCEGTWTVVLSRSQVQPDKLRRNETWLLCGDEHAVLVDYVPVSTGASSGGFAAGERMQAELAYYPSAVPQRALILRAGPVTPDDEAPLDLQRKTLSETYSQYEKALAAKPWLEDYPLVFTNAVVRVRGGSLHLVSEGLSLPVSPSQGDAAWPLADCGALDGVGIWNGSHIHLAMVETSLGRWKA